MTSPFRYAGFGLSGRVWQDLDGDGIQDAGELDFASVPLLLFDGDWNVLEQVLTDTAGGYGFLRLYRPEHTVVIIPPNGYVLSPRNQGGDDALDSDLVLLRDRATAYGTVSQVLDAGLMSGCSAPDEPCWIYLETKSAPENCPTIHWQDWNQIYQRTGWNVRRSNDPAPPKETWLIVASIILDGDAGTPNNQWTDISGEDPGPPHYIWYYQITAYNSVCDAEGPF